MPDGNKRSGGRGLLDIALGVAGIGLGEALGGGRQGQGRGTRRTGPTGETVYGDVTYVSDPATGRRSQWLWSEPAYDILGNVTDPGGWKQADSYFPQDAGDGSSAYNSQLDYQLGLKGLEVDWARVANDRERVAIERQVAAEGRRANMAQEAEARKQRALSANATAIDAYLTGTQLADARRLSALQEARALLPSLVSPDQQYFAGQEPGGALSVASARFGLPFSPAEIQHTRLSPGALAQTPTRGDVGSDIINYIGQVQQAGRA